MKLGLENRMKAVILLKMPSAYFSCYLSHSIRKNNLIYQKLSLIAPLATGGLSQNLSFKAIKESNNIATFSTNKNSAIKRAYQN
jgi:hypothetical protein